MSQLEVRADELKEKIKKLCDEFSEFAILAVYEDEECQHIELSGNLCPLCASEDLLFMILNKGLQHHKMTFPPSSDRTH